MPLDKDTISVIEQETGIKLKKEIKKKHDKILQEIEDGINWQKIVSRIADKYPLFYDKTNMFWLWNHDRSCYEITDETDLLNIVDRAVRKNTLRGSIKSQIVEAFRREGRIRIPKEPSKDWIQFQSTVYDITQKKTFIATPEYFFTNPLPYKIGISKETPIIDKLLNDWGGDYALTLKQILAYCTLRDYPIHRMFLLIGSGSNGKGTYNRLLNRFIGQENIASVEMDLLVSNQFHITKLHKKLCCQMSETNFSALKNTSILKKLCGGDLIGYEYKNKVPFDDYNYAKLIISTNSLPITHDKTDGFYRRWVIVDFNKQFDEKQNPLDNIPDVELENLGLWACEELAELKNRRAFHNEGTIQERKARYENRSNPLTTFLNNHYNRNDPNGKVPATDFYDDFSKYLSEHGMRSLTYQVVRSMMKEEGYEYEKHRIPLFDNPISCVIGISKKVSVPDVPAVPAFQVQKYSYENPTQIDGTSGTAGTDLNTIDLFNDLFKKECSDNDKIGLQTSYIFTKIAGTDEEWLLNKSIKGYIYEVKPGYWRPL